MPESAFTTNAYLRSTVSLFHDRTLEHFGVEDLSTLALGTEIERYPAGTTVQDVVSDVLTRIGLLETSPNTRSGYVSAFAYIYGWFSLTTDAVIALGGGASFTADAVIATVQIFTADAYIIEAV